MKLLLDMNLSPAWEAVFRAEDWEARHWSGVGRFDAPDAEIMAWARAHGFIVVTQDLDFTAILAATRAEGPSVVQLRGQDISPTSLGPSLVRILRDYSPLLMRGAILTVDLARWRFSFCCAACRRRTTPHSVRFLERRVYLAVLMTLACALSTGLSIRRAGVLTDGLHIPLRTLQRWRRLVDFVQTPFWQAKRALFMETVEESSLPESLRPRFRAEGDWGPWPRLLRFLTPLSSRTANGFGEGR